MFQQRHRPHDQHRRGVTLVELLVVIAILAILSAILVPQVRQVNKDRNIREAARVVASFMSNASQRGINEGTAGILLQRNNNIFDADGVPYACASMYLLRKVPTYSGDTSGAVADVTAANTVEIDWPFEQDDLGIIQPNDSISFNYSSVRYRILAVGGAAPTMELTLAVGGVLPALPARGPADFSQADNLPFVIYRQPRRLESSRVDLPSGYIIDFRFSGEIAPLPDTTGPPALPGPRPYFYEANGDAIALIFDSTGGIDRYYFSYFDPGAPTGAFPTPGVYATSRIPQNSLQFLIREYDPDEPVAATVLANPANMWVSVNQLVGTANVAHAAPADSALPLATQIINSRAIAQTGQSALQ